MLVPEQEVTSLGSAIFAFLAASVFGSVEEAQEEIQQVVEGVKAAKAVHEVSEELGIEMPIVNQVYRILYEGLTPRKAVEALMSRELKPESA